MRYFLCGQTGNRNRGCEAIVRSTVELLGGRRGDIWLATFAEKQDEPMAKQLGINLLPYASYPTNYHRYVFGTVRKLFKKSLAGCGIIEKPLFDRLEEGDVCLTIGGDTYCSGRPLYNLALNRFTYRRGIKNVLWCCSIEKEKLTREILEDLNRYTYIFAREQLTYDTLLTAGIPEQKVIKCCDPAFFLHPKPVELPEGLLPGNTVGINMSGFVLNEKNPFAYANVMNAIRYILDSTDMHICLIPHVYTIDGCTHDYAILKQIYDEVSDPRVSIVDKELTCEELKYIIAQCRFFVGARTHSTIAAYSSGVPTLVIGYSVKSKGIATDLFGTHTGYVLPYSDLTEKNELTAALQTLISNESAIKERYALVLPRYKKSLTDAIETYLAEKEPFDGRFDICSKELCTGCSACAQSCPKQCISMRCDGEGFAYPEVDFSRCVNCGICRTICPAANKPQDDRKIPTVFAAVNKNEEIRSNSSSGGVFTLLAEYILSCGGAVFGAGFDGDFHVVHKRCDSKEALAELRGSKYVQSDIRGTYAEAKTLLDSGRKVLFTGTPCQIGGLYAYLGKEYENLFTQDFTCHGVPSPMIWRKYVAFREVRAASKPQKIFFRNKKNGWKTYSMQVLFENQTEYLRVLTEDPYLRGYLAHLFLRPACHACSFKQQHRQSDLTVADFFGVDRILPAFHDGKGASLVYLHSEKGRALFDTVKEHMMTEPVSFADAVSVNRSYTRSADRSSLRDRFFKDADRLEMDELIEKYCGMGIASKGRRMRARYFGFLTERHKF